MDVNNIFIYDLPSHTQYGTDLASGTRLGLDEGKPYYLNARFCEIYPDFGHSNPLRWLIVFCAGVRRVLAGETQEYCSSAT